MAADGFADVDYYDFFSISPAASEKEIRRAYRKTSFLYHPDKVEQTAETIAKFQLCQLALAVLTDPSEKSKYDASREAKARRKAENEALEGRRRKMKQDLERREAASTITSVNGAKRTWSDRDLEIKRIQEQNRARMKAAQEKRAAEMKQAEEAANPPASEGDDMARSVKVRWIKEGEGLDIDDLALTEMFPVGDVSNVILLKDKKRKLDGRKVLLGTAVLVFKSLPTAKRAVANGTAEGLESMEWVMDKEEPS